MELNEKILKEIDEYAKKGVGLRTLYQTERGRAVRKDVLSYEGDIVSDDTLKSWGFLSRDRICVGKRHNVYFNPSLFNQAVLQEFAKRQVIVDEYRLQHTTCTAEELRKLSADKNKSVDIMFIALTDEFARKFIIKQGAAMYDNDNVEKCTLIRQYFRENPQMKEMVKGSMRYVIMNDFNRQMSKIKEL